MAGPHPNFSNLRVRSRERDLEAGQMMFRTGQRPNGAYQVMSGRVRMARVAWALLAKGGTCRAPRLTAA